MSRFTGPIDVRMTRRTENGRPVWALLSPLIYHVGSVDSPRIVEIPVGFDTDGVSVPIWLGWLVPVLEHRTFRPACVHDYLLTTRQIGGSPMTRAEIDNTLYEALCVMGVSRMKACAMWLAVRYQAFSTGDK